MALFIHRAVRPSGLSWAETFWNSRSHGLGTVVPWSVPAFLPQPSLGGYLAPPVMRAQSEAILVEILSLQQRKHKALWPFRQPIPPPFKEEGGEGKNSRSTRARWEFARLPLLTILGG